MECRDFFSLDYDEENELSLSLTSKMFSLSPIVAANNLP